MPRELKPVRAPRSSLVSIYMAQAKSLNLAHTEEVAEQKTALEACENKWYQAQVQGFEEGWLAALQALEVPKDSPLRNLEQIPRPVLATLV